MDEDPAVSPFRNPVSLAGAAVTTIAALLFLAFVLVDLLRVRTNPYLDLFFFVLLPGLFVLGLLLIPLGVWRERRRRRKGLKPALHTWPRIDLNHAATRRLVFAFVVLTPFNIAILALSGVKGVEAMDTEEFCGAVCHDVMEPEYVAHDSGPHHQVLCVTCHIGPGAQGFIRAKLNGTRQLAKVLSSSHRTPIPTPVEGFTAERSCLKCHGLQRWSGDRIKVMREYAGDEANTESTTTVRLHIGGMSPDGTLRGIHSHLLQDIEYVATDHQRQTIPYVRVRRSNGSVSEFFAEGVASVPEGERRQMDCVDCHSRPSHSFARSADRALNEAMAGGAVPVSLPFAKREALKVLTAEYPTQQEGLSGIAANLTAFYRQQIPAATEAQQQAIEAAIAGTQAIYRRSVFPSMKITWGTYPDHRGHMEFTGCFRCHDDRHRSKEGSVIKQDCDSCHEVS